MNASSLNRLKLIEELSNAYGASGFEDEVLAVVRKYASDVADISEDSIRNLYLVPKNKKGGKPVVMLDAHSDEVSFMVQAVKPNGTLRFIPLGGWVNNTIPAHKVQVRNTAGEYIPGIIASKPPHFMTAAEKANTADISNMVIDIGATSAEEAVHDFKIGMGEPVVPDVKFEYNRDKDLMLGKAFDCRLGCAAVVGTLYDLMDKNLNVDVVGALSTQEEMGARGAKVTAQTVRPDIAIVFEGCPADDTFTEPYMTQTALKKGPMLRYVDQEMITNPRFQRFALALGKKYGIPVQTSVRSGGSTNGAPIHTSGSSVPVIVIGLPVRYIHTHHCFASFEDYNNAVRLAVEIIGQLDETIIKGF